MIWFRQENPSLFEHRRVEGMKRSSLVHENLMRLHRERKTEWWASALKNPKLQATDQYIAAKVWCLRSPEGNVYEYRNLKGTSGNPFSTAVAVSMIGRARCLNAPDTRGDFASECRIATSHASAAALWGHSTLPARGEVKSSARGGFQRCPEEIRP